MKGKIILCLALLTALALLSGCAREAGQWNTEEIVQPVSALEMEIGAADITIRTGKQLRVETDNPYITVQVRGDTLVIREKPHVGNLESSNLILELPEKTAFRSVDLELGAGRLTAESLICNTLDMDLGAGQTEIQHLRVSVEAEINGGVGEIRIHRGNIRNLDLDMGVGSGQVTALLTGRAEIDTGVGSLNLTILAPVSEYTVKVSTGLGGVSVDDQFLRDGTYGTGPNTLNVSGGIGKVSVVFGKL